jgi:hypothetical protein
MDLKENIAAYKAGSLAEKALERVGEAVLARIQQGIPALEIGEEPLRFMTYVDSTSQPPSTELNFGNTFDLNQTYQGLSSDRQYEVFLGIYASARHALNRTEPQDKLTERNVEVYVFSDQSAVELITPRHSQNDPLFLPAVRAISWKQPTLLVGDMISSTEMNLFRLGYQEITHKNDTTFYRHYDPAMPMVGYGFAKDKFHLTIFNTGQTPALISISRSKHGQFVNLRQAQVVPGLMVSEEPTIGYQNNPVQVATRYPISLLEVVSKKFDVQLTDENAKRLLNGQKTDVINAGDGSTGKLYVLNTPDLGPQVVLQDVRPELMLKESYLGHVFTDRDKQNLLKYGDMGRAVDLIDRQSGQKFTGFIGVDKDTKMLTVLRADLIRPKIERMSHLKGIPLNTLQKQRLMEGKAIRLDNMTSKAGTAFSAYVRVSAAGRTLRFDHIPANQSKKIKPTVTPDNRLTTPEIQGIDSPKRQQATRHKDKKPAS